ncbi:hypothetical protein ABR738_01370 [Streptomyces sp. Edi4]|uniref:hypothetical protein n=1 Tax=Streptomyces sp. Edi4 TaxID=3162527 RepID=UPI00330641C5
MPGDFPHYTEDPRMDAARTQHRLLLEPFATTRSLFGVTETRYTAGCAHGVWPRRRPGPA